MNSIKIWLFAFRLRTLPLAIASIALGSFLAGADGAFQWRIALLAAATAVLLQILSNLANDYGDALHGADRAGRVGPQRVTQAGLVTKAAMQKALLFFTLLSLLVGYQLVKGQSVVFYAAGITAIAAAVGYTVGPRPYAYIGLGDLFVFLFFGLVGVLGSYYLHTQRLDPLVLLPAAACGLFCVAVLNVNNLRDLESDRRAGKRTLAVRLGARNARRYHWALLAGGWLAAVGYALVAFERPQQFAFLLLTPLLVRHGLQVQRAADAAALEPGLKQMALFTLLFSLVFGAGALL